MGALLVEGDSGDTQSGHDMAVTWYVCGMLRAYGIRLSAHITMARRVHMHRDPTTQGSNVLQQGHNSFGPHSTGSSAPCPQCPGSAS
jgi:hypothetical protein